MTAARGARETAVTGAAPAALHPWLEASLAQALGAERGHALLIHGARGIGQFELGRAIAAAGLCETPLPTRPASGAACGHCAACRLMAARTHPDLLVLVPAALRESLGLGGEEEGGDAAEGTKSKAKPSRDIKVDAVRATIEFAQQTAARGQGKAVLLYPAERMNPSSANMLLKTLEEPPGETRFVLVTAAPQRLLPTVRSRCQALAVPLPETAVAEAWLAAQGVDQPGIVLAAAGGAPIEALERLALGIDAAVWQSLPRELLAGRASAVTGWPVPLLVDTLQKLCHDLMAAAVGAAPRYFTSEVLPRSGDIGALTECAKALVQAARHAEHPWNAGLATEALVQRLARAAQVTPNAPRAGAAHGPLAKPLTTLDR